MKQLKLFIWILVITLLSVVVSIYCNIGGVVPNLLFAFVIAYSVLEEELSYRLGTALICAVISAAMGSRTFIMVVLMFVYSSVMTEVFNNKHNSLPKPLQTFIYAFLFTGICESIIYILTKFTISVSAIYTILPLSVMNAAIALIIYLILKAGMSNRRKNLIVS